MLSTFNTNSIVDLKVDSLIPLIQPSSIVMDNLDTRYAVRVVRNNNSINSSTSTKLDKKIIIIFFCIIYILLF